MVQGNLVFLLSPLLLDSLESVLKRRWCFTVIIIIIILLGSVVSISMMWTTLANGKVIGKMICQPDDRGLNGVFDEAHHFS